MDDQQLLEQIRELPEFYGEKLLVNPDFIAQSDHNHLLDAFHASKYKKYDKKLKWHQLVRLAIEPPEKREYLYHRLLDLLQQFGKEDEYFVFKTEDTLYHIPDMLSNLNKLKILYQKYFQIYKNILNQIHFDYPEQKKTGRIQGSIDWTETIRNNNMKFPTSFTSRVEDRLFETPENILLILCASWMNKESSRLLKINFKDPLSNINRKILLEILQNTNFILKNFPFAEVVIKSKRFWNVAYNSPSLELKEIEFNVAQRIRKGIVHNKNYSKLLSWIEEFRSLNIKNIGFETPTKHALDSLKNIDTVYEAWIFMEFVSFLKNKNILLHFELGKDPKCEFIWNETRVVFKYAEKYFPQDGTVWAKHHEPDYVAMVGSDVIGVFDAKNYSDGEPVGDTHDKMLAYMNNFDTNFGALIYPNHPPNWDMMTESQQSNLLDRDIFKNHFPAYTKSEKSVIRKNTLQIPWDDLKDEYKQIIPRWSQIISQNQSGKKSRYHFDQTLAYLKMSPVNDTFSIDAKNETLEYILKKIVSAIPLTVNQN